MASPPARYHWFDDQIKAEPVIVLVSLGYIALFDPEIMIRRRG